ncbi:MAG: hypothetical protein QNJ31_01655 [Candidatus Caenarcaniphilales bacterium]|nr:hypothetical protein [Candidatus Caenarcaniphilales bacterium]
MNTSSTNKPSISASSREYLEILNPTVLQPIDTLRLPKLDSIGRKDLFLIEQDAGNYSVMQSDGLINKKELNEVFKSSNTQLIDEKIIVSSLKVEGINLNEDFSLSFLHSYDLRYKLREELIDNLNRLDCLTEYIGFVSWSRESLNIPIALVNKTYKNSMNLETWIVKELKALSGIHDTKSIKLSTDTLSQLFEALGVSLAQLHNQIFQRSSFNNEGSFLNSSPYSQSDYEVFRQGLYRFIQKHDSQFDGIAIEAIYDSLNRELGNSLGIKLRCHGNLELNQIFKTTKGLKITDFYSVSPYSVRLNSQINTPIGDLADIIISIRSLIGSTEGRMIADIEEIINNLEESCKKAYLSSINFPLPEEPNNLLKAKLIEKTIIRLTHYRLQNDEENQELYQSILNSLIF